MKIDQAWPMLLVVSLFFGSCVTTEPLVKVSLLEFQGSLVSFGAQQERAQSSFNQSIITKSDLELAGDFKFSNPRAKLFIDSWKQTETEVRKLREAYEETRQDADKLFAALDERARSIRNDDLRSRLVQSVHNKRRGYSQTLDRANEVVAALEDAVALGNDVIVALEITGTLGAFESKLADLEIRNEEALDKLTQVSQLVEEGMTLVDEELASLEA